MDILTTREQATIVWLVIIATSVALIPAWRLTVWPPFRRFLEAAIAPALLVLFGLFALWNCGWVLLANHVGLWDFSLMKDTVIVTVSVGFPLLFRSINARSGGSIWHLIVRDTLALAALLAFYLNLEPFPFWLEFVGQATLAFLGLILTAAKLTNKTKPITTVVNVLLGLLVVAILITTTSQLLGNLTVRDWDQTIRELALSIWLPFTLVPFLYLGAFFSAAERATLSMRKIWSPRARRRVVIAAILGFHLRLRWARAFMPVFERRVSRARDFRHAVALMRDFRDEVVQAEQREFDRQAHLNALIGEVGTDHGGAHLDRREFEGTKRALEFLHTCQSGWYERLGNRYWDDRTDVTLDPTSRFDLPEDHGVRVELSGRRQRWRAWRLMPSTSYIAIGGRNGDSHEWLWQGDAEPDSWPGDEGWIDRSVTNALPPDWDHDDDF